jgi:competence protein ComGC
MHKEGGMNRRSGLSFVDILIILAIVLLLAALAVPRFVKVPDYGDEAEDADVATTNMPPEAATDTTGSAAPRPEG